MKRVPISLLAACLALAALFAGPAVARVRHHHHAPTASHGATRSHGSRRRRAGAARRGRRASARAGHASLGLHHRGVMARSFDHRLRRRAALCESVMIHRHWRTRCRGESGA
ncbi:MAG: hypothetical protein ACYC8V_05375 [Caulobacteraceae bacterium]